MSRILTLIEAKEALMDGEVVGIPTETVYGLAANALNEKAILRVFEIKKRPHQHPLICHLASASAVFRYARAGTIQNIHHQLAKFFWPGPMSLLLDKSEQIPDIVSSGLTCVAFRVPQHSLSLELLQQCEFPLAAPSANLYGKTSPTTAKMVLAELTSIAGVLDGGTCQVGIESTVLQVKQDKVNIFRPGGVTREMLLSRGFKLAKTQKEYREPLADSQSVASKPFTPSMPGMAGKHYAPPIPMLLLLHTSLPQDWLNKHEVQNAMANFHARPETSCYLAFGQEEIPHSFGRSENFSPRGELGEAAFHLFRLLKLDAPRQSMLLVCHLVPNHDLGQAINDRLKRAATLAITLA